MGQRKDGGSEVRLTHPLGKNPGDIFKITTQPFPAAHFATYPEELCIKPIKSSCPKNGIVLDPFAGSATTLLVAKKLWMNYGINYKIITRLRN